MEKPFEDLKELDENEISVRGKSLRDLIESTELLGDLACSDTVIVEDPLSVCLGQDRFWKIKSRAHPDVIEVTRERKSSQWSDISNLVSVMKSAKAKDGGNSKESAAEALTKLGETVNKNKVTPDFASMFVESIDGVASVRSKDENGNQTGEFKSMVIGRDRDLIDSFLYMSHPATDPIVSMFANDTPGIRKVFDGYYELVKGNLDILEPPSKKKTTKRRDDAYSSLLLQVKYLTNRVLASEVKTEYSDCLTLGELFSNWVIQVANDLDRFSMEHAAVSSALVKKK